MGDQQGRAYNAKGEPIPIVYDKDGNPITHPAQQEGGGTFRGLVQFLGDIGVLPGHAKLEDVERMIDWLPAAGGAFGGIVGGAGGTVLGMGIGGAPGAVAGSTLGGGTGEAVKQLANRVMGRPAPQTPGQAAEDIAVQGSVQGATEAAGGVLAQGLKRSGVALMQAAAKPPVRLSAKAIAKGQTIPIVKTLLDEGVNVSDAGIAKLNRIIEATNDDIKRAVNGLSGTIDPVKATRYAQDLIPRYANQVNPVGDVAAVKDAIAEFVDSRVPGLQNSVLAKAGVIRPAPASLTIPEAQTIKQGTYKALQEKAYGTVKTSSVEAQKAIARGLKDDIAAEAQKAGIDLNALNAREGGAIVAKEAIAKRIAAAGNHDPIALAWLTHHPMLAMGSILERSPAIKSMLARGLYQSAANAARVPKEVLRAILTAIAQSEDEQ